MDELVWIGIKALRLDARASIKLVSEDFVASVAEKDLNYFIYFFANVGEEV